MCFPSVAGINRIPNWIIIVEVFKIIILYLHLFRVKLVGSHLTLLKYLPSSVSKLDLKENICKISPWRFNVKIYNEIEQKINLNGVFNQVSFIARYLRKYWNCLTGSNTFERSWPPKSNVLDSCVIVLILKILFMSILSIM